LGGPLDPGRAAVRSKGAAVLVPVAVPQRYSEPQGREQDAQRGCHQSGPPVEQEAGGEVDRADQGEQEQDQPGDGVPVCGVDQLSLEASPEDGAVIASSGAPSPRNSSAPKRRAQGIERPPADSHPMPSSEPAESDVDLAAEALNAGGGGMLVGSGAPLIQRGLMDCPVDSPPGRMADRKRGSPGAW
jgi:hypothetical protein